MMPDPAGKGKMAKNGQLFRSQLLVTRNLVLGTWFFARINKATPYS
jgi:hypothetical protein